VGSWQLAVVGCRLSTSLHDSFAMLSAQSNPRSTTNDQQPATHNQPLTGSGSVRLSRLGREEGGSIDRLSFRKADYTSKCNLLSRHTGL
jgi:hypothetical protein